MKLHAEQKPMLGQTSATPGMNGQRKKRTILSKFFADRSGVSAVEFALVAPVLFIILTGIIQFGYAFFVQISMNNAAREGARELAVKSVSVGGVTSCGSAATGTAEHVTCGLLFGVTKDNATITACNPDNGNATFCPDTDNDVSVSISIPMAKVAIVDLLGIMGSGTMSAVITMREEGAGN